MLMDLTVTLGSPVESVTVDGDDVMVISGLLTPDLGVWRTPTGGGDICVTMLSDTQEVDMIPLVV